MVVVGEGATSALPATPLSRLCPCPTDNYATSQASRLLVPRPFARLLPLLPPSQPRHACCSTPSQTRRRGRGSRSRSPSSIHHHPPPIHPHPPPSRHPTPACRRPIMSNVIFTVTPEKLTSTTRLARGGMV